jgi:Galactose oxidase-like, Early set domain/Secretion system C-terminal sorting domain
MYNFGFLKQINMKRFSALLVFIVFSISTYAQFSISGNVTNGSNPVQWARITLFDDAVVFFAEARTDTMGNFMFSDIPQGTYKIGATALELEYIEESISISSDVDNLVFTLGAESHEGEWNVIMQSPESLGGTDLGILLPDGKIFYCHSTKDPFLFDPVINDTVFMAGDQNVQGCVAPALLTDGRIIFIGGTEQEIYGPGTNLVKTLNPFDENWETLPQILDYRWYPVMTQLPDRKLLVIGGGGLDNPERVKTSEIYDPYNLTVEQVDDIAIGNEVSPIVLLYTGEAFMTHRPPQLFNPDSKEWRLAGDFQQGPRMPNGDHSDHELVLLPDGRVVAVGYKSFNPPDYGTFIEIYDPVSDSWSLGNNFLPVRSRAKTVLLPDKKILVIGGEKEDSDDPTPTNQWNYMKLTDIYNPYNDSWRRLEDINIAREYHCNTILVPDGRVIAVGGEGAPGNEPNFSTFEAFQPPYLFKGIRPEIHNLNKTEFKRGEQIQFDIEKTNEPTSVILMSLQSVTHFMNTGNNRYLELDFSQSGNQISADVPLDSLAALSGYYMLIAMVDDIPSVAEIVKIEAEAIITSTKNLSSQKSYFRIFPNPAKDILTIELQFSTKSVKNLRIFDGTGKLVKQSGFEGASYNLDISEWVPGVYFLQVNFDGKLITKKFVKQ